jgi:lipoprotein-releasing system permease protein
MASPLSLLIALRFSRGRRRGGMVSLISVISTIGIALGVAVLIVGLSAMNGFERELNNRILAVVPHGEIEPVNQPWNNWNEALAKVEKVKGIVAAAPYINFTGLVESGSNMRAIQVKASTRSRRAVSVRCPTLCRTTRGPALKPANSR